MPNGHIQHQAFFDEVGTVSEIEISKAFISLAEGLQFMHNVQRRLHMNINPECKILQDHFINFGTF